MESKYYNRRGKEITKEQFEAKRNNLYRHGYRPERGKDEHYIIAVEFLEKREHYIVDALISGFDNLQKYIKRVNNAYIFARHSR